ncbi:MAG: dTMP kinase [Acidimicrobiales bacterium]
MTGIAIPGRLIAFEGIDGSGKTTQAQRLAQGTGALLTREPGGTALGRSLRKLLLEPSDTAVDERAEALLMAADRAQHVAEVLIPTLSSGRWVVSDRFSASTLAYQGYGRGIDILDLRALVYFATGGLEPDLTVLVDVPASVAAGRRQDNEVDRFEALGTDFLERVRQGYQELARAERHAWVVVDGSAPPEEVAEKVRDAITSRLGALPTVRT